MPNQIVKINTEPPSKERLSTSQKKKDKPDLVLGGKHTEHRFKQKYLQAQKSLKEDPVYSIPQNQTEDQRRDSIQYETSRSGDIVAAKKPPEVR